MPALARLFTCHSFVTFHSTVICGRTCATIQYGVFQGNGSDPFLQVSGW